MVPIPHKNMQECEEERLTAARTKTSQVCEDLWWPKPRHTYTYTHSHTAPISVLLKRCDGAVRTCRTRPDRFRPFTEPRRPQSHTLTHVYFYVGSDGGEGSASEEEE